MDSLLNSEYSTMTSVLITPDVTGLTALISFSATVLENTTSAQLQQVYETIVSTAFDDGFDPYSVSGSGVTLEEFTGTFQRQC